LRVHGDRGDGDDQQFGYDPSGSKVVIAPGSDTTLTNAGMIAGTAGTAASCTATANPKNL